MIDGIRNLVAGLRYAALDRTGYPSRLERYVRAAYLAGLTPWYRATLAPGHGEP